MTSSERHARLKQLFLAACDRMTEQRASFLDEACGGDLALRRKLEALLAHHDEDSSGGSSRRAGLPQGDRFAAGEIFGERYRIVLCLGRGGMGEVYRADDLKLGVPVALKFLRTESSGHLERLLNEVRLTREISHPAVCRVFDVGEAQRQTFFTMEYIEGEDLASQLRRIGRLPPSKVFELAGELCAGLAAAHEQGVLHRDLKPANIMVDVGGHARILDFGIAIREGLQDRIPAGTPAYMAPEQLVPGAEATEQMDLYALGLVLYELLAGRPVFAATTVAERQELQLSEPERPSTWATETDSRLEGMILHALREDPRERPSSARAMAQMLEERTSDAWTGGPPPTAGQRRQLTVMFCELEISARGPENLDPEDLKETARSCQQRIARVVERYDGRVAQYLGYGMLSYFGYPQAHEDDAPRALYAALAVVDELAQEAAAPKERAPLRQRTAVQVRLGIDTGPVVFGEAEEGAEGAPLAVGEAVNEAIHLIHGAEPGAILVSERTRRLVEGAFVLEELGGESLTRAVGPEPVYRVVRATGAGRFLAGSAPAGPTRLIGRDPELALLRDRWEQTTEGRGQVVLLSGEAGIGKSRLIRALRDSLSDRPHTWLECCGAALHMHSPFHPVIELFGHVLRFSDGQSPEEKLERLEKQLALIGLETAQMLPLLASLLALPLPERYSPLEMSAQLQRRRTLETLRAWVLALAERQPLVLVVEDLHWVDPTTLEWLGMLVEQVPTAALLIVLAARPEVKVAWARHSHLLQLSLSPLAPHQTAALVEAITGGRRIPPSLLDEIVKKTDGVPLFVEELTKSVLESGWVSEERSDLRPELGIPASLQDLLMARLDRLGSAKVVAQLGALLGREFTQPLLGAISPMDAARLEAALARLVDAELLYPRGAAPHAAYTFKHDLIRDTAYQSLLESQRRELHGRIADALQRQFPERLAREPEVVARHCEAAGRTQRAIDHYQRAGERATQHFAHAEAVAHFHRAIELLRSLPESSERNERELQLQIALGPSLIATKGYGDPEVEEVHERGRELCEQLGERPELFRVLTGLSIFYFIRNELPTARGLSKQALALAERAGETYPRVVAHTRVGFCLWALGELSRAHEHFEQAVRLYGLCAPAERRPLASVWGQDWGVVARSYAAFMRLELGHFQGARRAIAEAVVLAREGDAYTRAVVLAMYANIHNRLGEREAARKAAEELIAISREGGFPVFVAFARIEVGRALGGLRAVEEIQEAIAQLLSMKHFALMSSYFCLLAEAYLELGRTQEAKAALKEAFDRQGESRLSDPTLQLTRGRILLQDDPRAHADEAESYFRRALDIAREQRAKSHELRAATSLARLWRDQGRRAEARALLQPLYDWFSEGFDTADLKAAKALLEELS